MANNKRKSSFSWCFFSFLVGYGLAAIVYQDSWLHWIKSQIIPSSSKGVSLAQTAQDIPKPNFEFYTLLTQDPKTGEMIEHALPQGTQVSQASTVAKIDEPVVAQQPSEMNQLADKPMVEPITQTSKPLAETISSYQQAMVPHESSVFASTQPVSSPPVKTGGYLLQLAAFSKAQDAQRMTSSLNAKGFFASVVPVTQKGMVWYRVVLGPFASRVDAEHAQMAVVKVERITGMIKRSDG